MCSGNSPQLVKRLRPEQERLEAVILIVHITLVQQVGILSNSGKCTTLRFTGQAVIHSMAVQPLAAPASHFENNLVCFFRVLQTWEKHIVTLQKLTCKRIPEPINAPVLIQTKGTVSQHMVCLTSHLQAA